MSSKAKKNKSGIRILENDDFESLFPHQHHATPDENFEKLLEKSLDDEKLQPLLTQKQHSEHSTGKHPSAETIRSYPAPQDEIDLHGCTADKARIKAAAFIQTARMQGLKTVRIIVGKGIHSAGQAVLPDIIETQMSTLKKQQAIVTFQWEKRLKRKSGAILVYLACHPTAPKP
ncbi:MAG: Smr/MutS family protein [Deltaproteobacteria bacterium]|nr:Smr/MutS family protein [Deltaproteobacteria bacterium]